MTSEQGDAFLAKPSVDMPITFRKLLKEAYIPFTYAEFLGTYPIEPTVCGFSHSGETITPAQLETASVTANFYITDVYAQLLDRDGNQVLQEATRARQTGRKLLALDDGIHREPGKPMPPESIPCVSRCSWVPASAPVSTREHWSNK